MSFKRSLTAVLALCMVFTGTLTGCDTDRTDPLDNTDSNLTKVQDISVDEAKDLIDRNTNSTEFVILDVRTPSEYAQGHIAGAVNLDYYASFENSLFALDKNKTYLGYCRSGNRSVSASQLMVDNGFTSIYNMLGGINVWIANGLPLAT